MERKALYNALRVNWQLDPSLKVEAWQVEDYRSKSTEMLFGDLSKLGIPIDRTHFIALGNEVDSPEELAETLVPEHDDDVEQEFLDRVYLIVFDLWRRLLPEKQTLSIFCDELDHLIDLYDSGQIDQVERIEDIIGNMLGILAENVDEGQDPHALFASILQGCAHDVEGFLYDFIAMQIDTQHTSYARDLIEAILPYAIDVKWFQFLQAQVLAYDDVNESHTLITQLIKECQKNPDLEFSLELLAYLAKKGEERSFIQLMKQTSSILHTEEDFWDLLSSCEDFFHYKDSERQEQMIAEMRSRRFQNHPHAHFSSQDSDLSILTKAFLPHSR